MKKTTWIILAFCIVISSCTGCGDNKDSSSEAEQNSTYSESEIIMTTENTTRMTTETLSTEQATVVTTEMALQEKNPREDILIAIDPGHQSEQVDMSAQEPNAPGSSEMKMKATGGTTGRYTGVPEYQLNLDISLKLRDALVSKGYKVIMTREDNDTAISNMERAILANENGADIAVRIHANGSEDPGTNGALALIGSEGNPYVGALYDSSYHLANSILQAYCDSTGMKNLGINTNDTMTGINWSKIPVMILEMGFMSNESDDRNMEDPDYQSRMVEGIVSGIENYYDFKNYSEDDTTITGGGTLINGESEDTILKKQIDELLENERSKGAVCSAYAKNLRTGDYVDLSTATHRSASIIKLYIAGCVYSNIGILSATGNTENDIDMLVNKMIANSDNEAANTLVKMLGAGDSVTGMSKVTEYAKSLGCIETKMGRLMLDFDSENDNYTTVTETGSFLERLYNGEIEGYDKIITYMKAQERTSKIPAGLPSNVVCANKTGELDDVEHDVAIVYGEDADYIICIMLSQLSDTTNGRETIQNISSLVYDHWR